MRAYARTCEPRYPFTDSHLFTDIIWDQHDLFVHFLDINWRLDKYTSAFMNKWYSRGLLVKILGHWKKVQEISIQDPGVGTQAGDIYGRRCQGIQVSEGVAGVGPAPPPPPETLTRAVPHVWNRTVPEEIRQASMTLPAPQIPTRRVLSMHGIWCIGPCGVARVRRPNVKFNS